MTMVAARLPEELIARLDALVDEGRYPSRSQALREAVERLLQVAERDRIDRAIVEGYRRVPPDASPPPERARMIASIEEEPW